MNQKHSQTKRTPLKNDRDKEGDSNLRVFCEFLKWGNDRSHVFWKPSVKSDDATKKEELRKKKKQKKEKEKKKKKKKIQSDK
jgi:hypothetical protein